MRFSSRRQNGWVRIGLFVLVFGLIAYRNWQVQNEPASSPPPTASAPQEVAKPDLPAGATSAPAATTPDSAFANGERTDSPTKNQSQNRPRTGGQAHFAPSTAQSEPVPDGSRIGTRVRNQTIRDQSGKTAYQGDIELTDTLARIERRQRLGFPNDGSVFQNRERRLPRREAGYYHEWVHPTPGLNGPGPQRIVTGADGEIYYTPDHYRTFQRVETP